MKRLLTSVIFLVVVQNFTGCTSRSIAEVCVTKAKSQLLLIHTSAAEEEEKMEEEFHPLIMLNIPF
jgi:hypothetical protein